MKLKVLIAGQEGMVGRSIYNLLKNKNKKFRLLNCKRKDLDFTNQLSVEKWFKKNKPDIVINAAGKVGGIMDNSKNQSDYIYINTMIGLNIINSAFKYNVKQLINLGSACIYPRNSSQPISEEALLSSNLEKTNEGYALAKILSLKYCQHLKIKKKKNFISLMPANLYGEGDNFDLKSSHVLPALVKKFVIAKKKNLKNVEIWGSGNVKREFLHVDDLSNSILFLINKKINHDYVNIGGGEHFSIKRIAILLKKITKYSGKIIYNKKYPEGVKKRLLNSKIIYNLGWNPKIKLEKGLESYCKYYEKEIFPYEKN